MAWEIIYTDFSQSFLNIMFLFTPPIHQPAFPITNVLKIQNKKDKTESKSKQKFTEKKILFRGRIDL